jgi:SAM-dependent methyltransferase
VGASDPDLQRAENLDRWERAADGWGRAADRVRDTGMPVSVWMIEQLALQPGQLVLELAAGPGDTGFLAAELIRPGGVLVCSDGTEAMLAVARARAKTAGIENVEFARLELEWIDLPTASVDAVLCRWGIMLIVDPEAAAQEIRRVLRSGGRAAFAVWDSAERNPWATISGRALVKLGHATPPDPNAPGMFVLAAPGRLRDLLQSAGFVDVLVEAVQLDRPYAGVDRYIEETLDLSGVFRDALHGLSEAQRIEVVDEIASLAEPFTDADGSLLLPGSSLVAAAGA